MIRRGAPRRLLLALAVAAAAGMPVAGAAQVPTLEIRGEFVPGRLVVKFDGATSERARADAHRRAGARVARRLTDRRYDLVEFSPAGLRSVAERYLRNAVVRHVEPDYIGRIAAVPNDPCFASACGQTTSQWNLWAVNAPFAWDTIPGRFQTAADRRGAPLVKVAVLDTRIDQTHPDFANPGGGVDAADGGQLALADAQDFPLLNDEGRTWAAYHGTMVAGILGAATGNGTDIAGVGYAAQMIPISVTNDNGVTTASSLAEAIIYANSVGARVINLSLGIQADAQVVRDALIAVTTAVNPSLVVAAAGNNTGSQPFYPGSYPEVMSVSAVDANRRIASCSNYNNNVSVSAPGAVLTSLTLMPQRIATIGCGTSAATPHVSGLAALLFTQDPTRTPAEVRSIIERTSLDLGTKGKDQLYGWGEIDVDRALHNRTTDGPVVTGVSATTPPAGGGQSTITARATAASAVTTAEAWMDTPTSSSVPIVLQPADGAWDEPQEDLTAEITIGTGVKPGLHTLYVRAFDSGWGAVTLGTLIVDRTGPSITKPTASPSIAGLPSDIAFTLSDTYSSPSDVVVRVIAPGGAVAAELRRSNVYNGKHAFSWTPEASRTPGFYRVQVLATDRVGNLGTSAMSEQFLVV